MKVQHGEAGRTGSNLPASSEEIHASLLLTESCFYAVTHPNLNQNIFGASNPKSPPFSYSHISHTQSQTLLEVQPPQSGSIKQTKLSSENHAAVFGWDQNSVTRAISCLSLMVSE